MAADGYELVGMTLLQGSSVISSDPFAVSPARILVVPRKQDEGRIAGDLAVEEAEGYGMVKAIVSDLVDPSRIHYWEAKN